MRVTGKPARSMWISFPINMNDTWRLEAAVLTENGLSRYCYVATRYGPDCDLVLMARAISGQVLEVLTEIRESPAS